MPTESKLNYIIVPVNARKRVLNDMLNGQSSVLFNTLRLVAYEGDYMADERATVTWEELSWSNHIEQEALVRILIDKGILSQEELLDEVRAVQKAYQEQKL